MSRFTESNILFERPWMGVLSHPLIQCGALKPFIQLNAINSTDNYITIIVSIPLSKYYTRRSVVFDCLNHSPTKFACINDTAWKAQLERIDKVDSLWPFTFCCKVDRNLNAIKYKVWRDIDWSTGLSILLIYYHFSHYKWRLSYWDVIVSIRWKTACRLAFLSFTWKCICRTAIT